MMKIRDIINLLEKNTEGYDEDELLTIKIAPYDLDINIFLSLQIEKGVGIGLYDMDKNYTLEIWKLTWNWRK